MLVSDYILKFLLSKGVKKVFLLTGGAIAFTVDAFARNKNISYVSVAHEQAAAMMADSYSRLGPNFAATMVTSGPGATNLLTGIACSWFDSIPIFIFVDKLILLKHLNIINQQKMLGRLVFKKQILFQWPSQ